MAACWLISLCVGRSEHERRRVRGRRGRLSYAGWEARHKQQLVRVRARRCPNLLNACACWPAVFVFVAHGLFSVSSPTVPEVIGLCASDALPNSLPSFPPPRSSPATSMSYPHPVKRNSRLYMRWQKLIGGWAKASRKTWRKEHKLGQTAAPDS